MSFSINCLEITATREQWKLYPSLYKNLLSENDYDEYEKNRTNPKDSFKKRFFFNDFYEHNQYGQLIEQQPHFDPSSFFEKGINIQAIVGKNGSGKSTLMDIMYMAINNFAFLFEQGKVRPGADELYYVKGVFLNLYFIIDDERRFQEYKLECKEEKIKLLKKEKKWWVIVNRASFGLNKPNKWYNKGSDRPIASLVSEFFYTIVSNYSMQSFISSNYIERTLDYGMKDKRRPWINSIFYKNDGYVRPIVLNPFRNSGIINLENEQSLSKDRAASLFIYSFYEEKSFFRPYVFFDLKIKYNPSIVREKINRIILKNEKKRIFRSEKSILKFIQNEINRDESFLHHLEKKFFFKLSIGSPEKSKICAAYVMFKIWKLTKKYNFYASYAEGMDYLDEEGFVVKNKKMLNALFRKITQDNSHVTKKIKRTLNYLLVSEKIKFKDSFNGSEYFKFLKESYLNRIRKSGKAQPREYLYFNKNNPFTIEKKFSFLSPSRVDLCLPPPVFSYDLILKKVDHQRNERIKYNNLSSGELQLLQTLSVHAYHVSNLLSVQEKGRPQYRNINLIFDEVEICFHPEYQRSFINRFVEMVGDMKWTNSALINVFVMTHSPFILSDIPSNRVLYMDEGSMDKKKDEDDSKETFGQNIGNLLCNSFFLKYYVGDFAKKKINEILDEFVKNKSMSREEFEGKIQIFGDELLKQQMMNYFDSHGV